MSNAESPTSVRDVFRLASAVTGAIAVALHQMLRSLIHFEEQSQDLPEMREAQEQNRQEPTARGIDLRGNLHLEPSGSLGLHGRHVRFSLYFGKSHRACQGESPLSCRVLGGKYSP